MSGFTYLGAPDFTNTAQFILPIHITAIGEVLEDGLTVCAVRIEFSGSIQAGVLKSENFQIPGRSVIQTYVNDTGERHKIAREGRYLLLELLVNTLPDSNELKERGGKYKYTAASSGWTIELPLVISVRHIDTAFCADGRAVVPFNKANDGQYVELVDDLLAKVYCDGDTGIKINYNLFVPKGYEKKSASLHNIPLVFFLHGAGESGFDNRSPVTSYRQALAYCGETAQAETPCFLMIPQCPVTEERDRGMFEEYGWYTYISDKNDGETYTHPSGSLKAAINAMLIDVIPSYNIDCNRVYAVGHSMGAGGALSALAAKPDVFAASLCFASAAVFSKPMLEKIKQKPLFFAMAEDDEWDIIRDNMPRMVEQLEKMGRRVYRETGGRAWDATLRGDAAIKQAGETISRAEHSGASLIYAEYMRGSVTPFGHLSHRAGFENAAIRRWLFQQHL